MNTDRFDDAVRAAHADALDHLSPRVRAQLNVRRRAALDGRGAQAKASPWRFALPLAAACAVGAIAINLQFRNAPEQAAAPIVATTTHPVSAPADDTVIATTLEEDPALYVWLANDGAALVAQE